MTMKSKEVPVRLARTEREAMPMRLWETGFPFNKMTFRRPFDLFGNPAEDLNTFLADFGFRNDFPRSYNFEPFHRLNREMFEWTPPFEMFERDGKWIVKAELPGMAKEDITVEVNDEYLTLHGKRENKFEEKKDNFYRTEFTYGDFYRRIPLPEGVDIKDAKAMFNNGVLEITFAAPHLAMKGKKLEIKETAPKAMTASN